MLYLKHFKPSEFEHCVPKCYISDMDEDFLRCLDLARDASGVVFRLNSAYRSPEYDFAHSRTGHGFHTKGRAVDVSCFDSVSRLKIVAACKRLGLSCGVAKNFIHIDNRGVSDGYPEPILFLY